MKLKSLSYTCIKHYYTSTTLSAGIGSERIASTLGTRKNLGVLCEAIYGTVSAEIIAEMNNKVEKAGETLENSYTIFEKKIDLDIPYLYSENEYIANCGDPDPDRYASFWFHPDHLGSSNYITDMSGNISQHMEYLPFGETLVEEHKNSNNSPYKFNGKELDDETGNYYYGARYYNPKFSIWLSVDPLAEKYPGWSPYNYTLLNPVKLVDPDGRSVDVPPDDYKINKKGEITRIRETDDDFDVLYNSDLSAGIQVDEGILGERVKTDFRTKKDEEIVCQPIQLLDATKGKSKELFEFAAQNSSSEFSLQEFENGKTIIGTSFENDIELSGGFTLKKYGKWSEHTHSHPIGKDPSPSPGDIKAVDYYNNDRGFNTDFKVYNPSSGEYKRYDENFTNELEPVFLETKK